MTATKFWTPGGLVSSEREEVRMPPEYVHMLMAFAETSGMIDIGIHCSLCKADLRGANGRGDARWVMECACRTFIGANPLPKGN